MQNTNILIFLIIIMIIIMLSNSKVALFSVLLEQIKVFKNYNTKKISIFDTFCFIIFPIIISNIIVWGFSYTFDENMSNVLITVFSIIFTLLFGFATLLISNTDNPSEIKNQVISETFVSIISSMVASLFSALLLIINNAINCNQLITKILTVIILFLAIYCLMLLLLITKRTFKIFEQNNKNQG